jgi:antitoxin (DNA-binding transcriptional repressor) of toxin-antitoxin stability system
MTTITIEQAQRNLSRVIDDVTLGEHVVITRDHIPVAELAPVTQFRPKPMFGSAKGMVKMSDDFDVPIEGFEDYEQERRGEI